MSYHMTPEEFRRHGRLLIDWIADYMETVEQHPVLSQEKPGTLRAALPPRPPDNGESFEEMLADVDRLILPGITHWQSPSFFAFFPANASGPGILGELLSAGLGVQGMLWATSPACTELEEHMMDWLVDLLALPDRFRSDGLGGGVIQDSASSATLVALLAARERATGGHANRAGTGERLATYASTQAHSSVEKAVRIAGLGSDNLRHIEVDEAGAMVPYVLEESIKRDREAGLTPVMVTATVGTTSSNGIDPVRAIGEICRREGVWLHVDAAMAGTAAVCPEFRYLHDGLELADSYCFNPHKWMFTNFDCDAFFVADRRALVAALSILPEYLRNEATQSGEVTDYRDWQIPLGRRFRALKLWFVLRHYGSEGIRHHVREHVRLAQMFKGWVDAAPEWELAAPAPLNLVCFRHRAGDGANREIMDAVNAEGDMYLTHTRIDGQMTLRMSIGQTWTQEHHVRDAWGSLQAAAAAR